MSKSKQFRKYGFDWEVYYVSNPQDALQMPGHLHWAVARNGNFEDSFRTKRDAMSYIDHEKERQAQYTSQEIDINTKHESAIDKDTEERIMIQDDRQAAQELVDVVKIISGKPRVVF